MDGPGVHAVHAEGGPYSLRHRCQPTYGRGHGAGAGDAGPPRRHVGVGVGGGGAFRPGRGLRSDERLR